MYTWNRLLWWLRKKGKEPACNAGDPDPIPGSGRSPGEGNGNPLQYSCLENFMDRGDWQATVRGVAKSGTWLSTHTRVHAHTHTHAIVIRVLSAAVSAFIFWFVQLWSVFLCWFASHWHYGQEIFKFWTLSCAQLKLNAGCKDSVTNLLYLIERWCILWTMQWKYGRIV